jgi:spore coat polysaccharide biosynthesis protein SpsF
MEGLKTLIVVQCRYNSFRLPGKALYPLCGIPMIAFLLRRLRATLSDKGYHITLATTTFPQDDVLVAWGLQEGVHIVRGEEDDLLKRYIRCLAAYPAETVVRVTADNPLTCPEMLKWLVREQQEKHVEYVQCENLPYGAGVDVFSSGVLRFLDKEVIAQDEREHINLHILRNLEKFTTLFLNIEGERARPELRMTVDFQEDWEHIKSVFLPEDPEPWRISLAEAIIRMDTSSDCE